MKLKQLIPTLIAALIIMPIAGVGWIWYSASNEKAERIRAQEERMEMEAKRRAELAAEAKRRSEAAAKQLPSPGLKE